MFRNLSVLVMAGESTTPVYQIHPRVLKSIGRDNGTRSAGDPFHEHISEQLKITICVLKIAQKPDCQRCLKRPTLKTCQICAIRCQNHPKYGLIKSELHFFIDLLEEAPTEECQRCVRHANPNGCKICVMKAARGDPDFQSIVS